MGEEVIKYITGGAITTGLFTLCIWWLTRYIKDRDDFEKSIKDDIKKVPERIKESVAKIDEAQNEMRYRLEHIKNTQLDYQSKVNAHLSDIERHALKTESVMERTAEKASSLEHKLVSMNDMIVFHDKVLRDLIGFSKDLKGKVQENSDQIQTVKKHINENLVIIGQKKKNSDNKE